ncbi:unnamed protein product [Sphagnum tenellum]
MKTSWFSRCFDRHFDKYLMMENDMRRWMRLIEGKMISVCEAMVDFTAATTYRDHNEFAFTLPIGSGGWIQIDARVHLARVIYIRNIQTFADDHPDQFKPNRESYRSGVRLGNGETRRMLRFVVDRIRQDFPHVDKIVGDRLTGARANSDFSMTDMAI